MRALASSLGAWRQIEREAGTSQHGLVFPLAIVEAIGRPHGLELVAEEETDEPASAFDAIFISVMNSRCMVETAKHFAAWGIPMRSADRSGGPLIFAGGAGLACNPRPFEAIADVIVVGDAEDPLPVLLSTWDDGLRGDAYLDGASGIPGVFVPARLDLETGAVEQSVSADVAITLRHSVQVNHDVRRRMEIARGCKYKCAFCDLGWRSRYRENDASAVAAAIASSPRLVHLQAGDAESHSGIVEIRAAARAHGAHDSGWTGRLDSVLRDASPIGGGKRFAFGVEGVTARLRRAVGKGYLTDERLVADTLAFMRRVGLDARGRPDPLIRGRAAWHMIAGLPWQQRGEEVALIRVLMDIDKGLARAGRRTNLTIHWQPFSPLPGTPLQWAACGGGARRMAGTLRPLERAAWLGLRQLTGRSDTMSRITTMLARSTGQAVNLMAALGAGRVSVADAERLCGAHWREMGRDEALPWDGVETDHRRALRRAWDVAERRARRERPTAPNRRTHD